MPFRFFQRIRIAPGLTLNLSKRGVSVSAGPRGLQFTAGTSGTRATVGLPGSGLFYTVHNPLSKRSRTNRGSRASENSGNGNNTVPRARKPSLGFFKRLVTPAHEKAFVDGLAALSEGRHDETLRHLESALQSHPALADAAWLAGLLRLNREDHPQAAEHFRLALQHAGQLGRLFDKYQLTPRVSLPVTPEVTAQLPVSEAGALLGLIEALQLQGSPTDALPHLESLLRLQPNDPVALASLADIALEGDDPKRWQQVVTLTADIANDTAIHTAVLLYRALALVKLGMDHAALDVFTATLRRRSGRPEALLRDLRYQRALVYERTGRKAQARREFERVYAEDPAFEDVAQRLGV